MSEIEYIRDTNLRVIAQGPDGGEITSQSVEANLLIDIYELIGYAIGAKDAEGKPE